MGFIKGDTRSLDYGSNELLVLEPRNLIGLEAIIDVPSL